jgi:hypothetical protein
MAKITLAVTKRKEVIDWLSKTVSPKKFYLHTMEGGVGWCVGDSHTTGQMSVDVDNDEIATFLMLRFS